MHPTDCPCTLCAIRRTHHLAPDAALAVALQRQAEALARHGWVAHVLADRPLIHTHGLQAHFGHPDLEIRLAVPPAERFRLLAPLAEAVCAGRRFRPGDTDHTVFPVPVRFVWREESGRMVVRAIFPDPGGRFPDDFGCDPRWAAQVLQDADADDGLGLA